MLITAIAIILACAVIIPGLRNGLYVIHVALVAGAAWWLEQQHAYAQFKEQTVFTAVIIHLIAINITTFIAYGWDKRAASRADWRVPEKTLHAYAFIGGFPGALIAQKIFRHKTRKKSFRAMMWLIFMIQLVLFAIFWLKLRG